jgi:hypothetical protein
MKLQIPLSPDKLGGPFALAETGFTILAERDRAIIVEFSDRPPGIEWFDDFDTLFCPRTHDADTCKVLRKATDEELKRFRIPVRILMRRMEPRAWLCVYGKCGSVLKCWRMTFHRAC